MIVDLHGKPIRPVRGYGSFGASHVRKSLQGWVTSSLAPDDDITRNIETLRARSRDLFMGSPLAAGAIKTMRTNIVGSGLSLNPHIDRETLGLNDEQAEKWEHTVEKEWLNWSNSIDCDAAHMCNFYQLQALALMSALMSGDCFVGLPYIKRQRDVYGLKVYLIEADRVSDPLNDVEGLQRDIMEGVEIGDYGEPVAYWVSRYHPYTLAEKPNKPQQWYRVSAFGDASGRRQILHIMPDFERPGQRRGVPLLAPVIESLKQLERYTDAELMAAVVSGLFTVFVTTEDGGGLGSGDLFGDLDGTKDRDLNLGNGSIVELNAGESVSTATPGRPNANFGGFVESICRQIGSAIEIPYELLIKNFTASYSASRASLLEAWKMFRMRRQWLVDSFCQPIYEAWLSEAVAIGRIDAPQFFLNPTMRKAWCQADWSGDSQGQLDPQKEAQAAVTRIQNGLSTREREAAELTGMSINTIISQLAKEQRLCEENGITLSTGNNTNENLQMSNDEERRAPEQ